MRLHSSLALALSLTPLALAQSSPTVTSGNTTFQGVSTANDTQVAFLGIPFAKPPVGALRFKAPVKLDEPIVPTTVSALQYGKGCLQVRSVFGIPANQTTLDEDCLSLNIYRPAQVAADAKLPVFFWIYGGGFFSGVSEGYDPTAIIAQSVQGGEPVIYVSTNYRTGLWGFLNGEEAANNGAANAGLKDQRLALQWVQEHIGAFGGDPEKVTILGESAGSISVGWQLLRPTEGLFRGAVMESGSPGTYPATTAAQRQVTYDAIAQVAGCSNTSDSFACLQNASREDLILAMGTIQNASTSAIGGGGFAFGPVLDGWISGTPQEVIANGSWAKVPFIDGNNRDEGTIFTLFSKGQYNSTQQIVDYFGTVFPLHTRSVVEAFVNLYSEDAAAGAPFGTGNETFGRNAGFKRLAALWTDAVFTGARRSFLKMATQQGIKAFGYLFTQEVIPAQATDSLWLGVYHSAELDYVYNGGDYALPAYATADQKGLSTQMIEYWLQFIRNLDPNVQNGTASMNLAYWPPYTSDGTILNLTSASPGPHTISDNYRPTQINYIMEHPALN